MTHRLTIRDLSTPVLNPISLSLDAGQGLAVIGPSGSGKTSLFRAIADLDPNEGTVLLDGTPREGFRPEDWRRRVRFVPAEPGWWLDRAGDHLDSTARDIANDLGLDTELLSHPVTSLSTGERQRLALAMGFAAKPEILLLDEPTAALDEANRDKVETLILEALGGGASLMLISHDPDQIARLGFTTLEIGEKKPV